MKATLGSSAGWLLFLIVLLHSTTCSTAIFRFKWLEFEWPEPPFIPTWLSLPWGPSPDWGLIHKTLECRVRMDKQLGAVTRPCEEGSVDPVCNMKVQIISAHAGEYTKGAKENRYEFAESAQALKDQYCQRWKFCENVVRKDPTFDPSLKADDRSPAWLKVLAVREELLKGKFDWYMWMDGDAAFIDHSFDLRFLIASKTSPELGGQESKIFLVSKDIWNTPGGGSSNTGVWIIKNGTASLAMLDRWWESANEVKEIQVKKMKHPWEQFAFNTDLFAKYEFQIERLDECWLFGHPLSLIDKPFIAHLCGIANQQKLSERHQYFQFWKERMSVESGH